MEPAEGIEFSFYYIDSTRIWGPIRWSKIHTWNFSCSAAQYILIKLRDKNLHNFNLTLFFVHSGVSTETKVIGPT